jgi:sugar lactone lactonase YvrE
MADRIRKINVQTGEVHMVVKTGDQLPPTASLWGICVSANGTLYAADNDNYVVYKIFEDGRVNGAIVGKLTTPGDVASSGLSGSDGNTARLRATAGICVDSSDNIYVADGGNHKIKRLSPSGRCQTLAGTGVAGDVCSDNGLLAQFNVPYGVCVDAAGIVYVCDSENDKIKKIWPSGKVTSLAGGTGGGMANGNGAAAKFDVPVGICINKSRKLFVVDNDNYRIRQVDEAGNVVTLAGFTGGGYVDGVGNAARFSFMYDICVDNSGVMYVIDAGNSVIRKVLDNGTVSTLTSWKNPTIGTASAIAVDNSGFLYILEKNA